MSNVRRKTAIIGSGNVGANAALFIALSGVSDVALIDIVDGLAEGRAIDISQALAIIGNDARVTGSGDFAALEGSDIVVVTAGLPRQPGMTRIDLLHKNAAIIKSAAGEIKKHAPGAIVIVVTNPLDIMTYLAFNELGADRHRVMGMGGLLDSGRFNYFLAEKAGVSRADIAAFVIGSHGDEMVPLTSTAAAGGTPFSQTIGAEALAEAAESARMGGAQIVGLLKKGSAAYGPGAAISRMVGSILADEKRVFSVCAYTDGEYGQCGIFLNLPAVLGSDGVERILEVELSPKEKEDLAVSAEAVRTMLNELP